MRKKTKILLTENNRAEEALSPEGRALLTDIVVYLRSSRASTWEQELVRRDITQMLLDAEARKENPRTVIGPDPKAFCDSVIEELPPMPQWKRILSIVRDGLLAATVLMMIWTVFGVLEGLLGVGSWPNLTLTMGQLIAGAGILMTASGLVYWICRSSFSVDQKKSHWVILFLIVFVLLCLGVFLRQPIAVIPVPAIVVFIVVLFLVYKLLDSRLD